MPGQVGRNLRGAVAAQIPVGRVKPQHIVAQQDGVGGADIGVAHHYLQVDAGTVLADLAGGGEHFNADVRVGTLQRDQGRGNKFCAESVHGADPHHAGQRIGVVRKRAAQRTEALFNGFSRTDRLGPEGSQFPAARCPGQGAAAQLFLQRDDPPRNGGVRGAQGFRDGSETSQPGHGEQDQQVVRAGQAAGGVQGRSSSPRCARVHMGSVDSGLERTLAQVPRWFRGGRAAAAQPKPASTDPAQTQHRPSRTQAAQQAVQLGKGA